MTEIKVRHRERPAHLRQTEPVEARTVPETPAEQPAAANASQPPERDYEIGYGRPPKKHQFPPNTSGNLKGRPLKSKNLATLVLEELDCTIPVTEGGVKRKKPKRKVLATTLVNDAIKGKPKAIDKVFEIDGGRGGPSAAGNGPGAAAEPRTHLIPSEQEIVDLLVAMAREADQLGGRPA